MILEDVDEGFPGPGGVGNPRAPPVDKKVPLNPTDLPFSLSQASTSVASPSFMACVRPFRIPSTTS